MSAIDFPASPTVGQSFTAGNSVTYVWNGLLWLASGASAGGDFMATAAAQGVPGPPTVLVLPTVTVGNSGGWYNTSNGRYTPPAGRYRISAHYSAFSTAAATAATLHVGIRKNGVQLIFGSDSSPSQNLWGSPSADMIVDANGTDYFEMTWSTTVVATADGISFSAFPISGIKGPPGDPGQLGWRLLQRVVPTAGQQFIDFTGIPPDINNLQCFLGDVLPTSNDAGIGMQFFDAAGVIVASGTYQTSNALTTAAMPTGTASPSTGTMTANLVVFNYQGAGNGVANNVEYGFSASVNIYNIRDTARTKKATFSCNYLNGAVTTENTTHGGGHLPISGAITGLRFQFFPGTFAAGGAVTLWGSP